MAQETIREAVAAFTNVDALEHAVQDLLTNGFNQGDLSLLARDEVMRREFEGRLDIPAIADDPEAHRTFYPSPEGRIEARGALAGILGYVGAVTAAGLTFATGGAAAVAIAAGLIAGGGGAAFGAGLGKVLDQRIAGNLERQLDEGGILLWVRVVDDATELVATRLLAKHGGRHIHIHAIPA